MDYGRETGDLKNWLVSEATFNAQYQGKCEAIFCLGNGYMGIRSATEESYTGQVRNCFVAGTFNRFDESEVTELPNTADVTAIDIYIDNELFSLEKGQYDHYHRTLNLKTGELERAFNWTNREGKLFRFQFSRFVSMNDLHLTASKVTITPVNCEADIRIISGINGRMTNSGSQHFQEGMRRVFDKRHIQMVQQTIQSDIYFVHHTTHKVECSGKVVSGFEMDRRRVHMIYDLHAGDGGTVTLEKISNIHTSRDRETEQLDPEGLKNHSLSHIRIQSESGYDKLLKESIRAWTSLWSNIDVVIESENDFDQLAIRFAQYHLLLMTPQHDPRFSIGAKGFSGEGYKGHTFWDTEIFVLPFFTFVLPDIARSLLKYRYLSLGGAHKKAKVNGFRGAMYPWESAWLDDGEVTPLWGVADVVTGKAMKIQTGVKELHITSDVAFGVWQYYLVTGDEDFMKHHGYEIFFDTAIFWGSRLEFNKQSDTYHINNVIGPDEYKEHINDDAFTNHMAHWCIENSIYYYDLLKEKDTATLNRLNKKLDLDTEMSALKGMLNKIYRPQPDQESIIPQNDSYMKKKIIDLSKYKNQQQVASIFKDYNIDQINEIQVTKQASVVMLLYLLEHKFTLEIKRANFHFYESRTLHDSSLSLSSHAVLACDVGQIELAYRLFREASEIDLGPNMKTSDEGVHAASLGGIWQIIACGFGGLRMVDGKLRINPTLPRQIKSITYPITWKGNPIKVTVSTKGISIENRGNDTIEITVRGKEYELKPGRWDSIKVF